MAVDMTVVTMFDDVNISIEAAHLTSAVKAIAGYVNGRYANWPAIVQKWGNSGLHLLSIDVQGLVSLGAQCLDIETGDAKIGQAAAWYKGTKAAGVAARDLRYFPKLYVSAGNMASLIATLKAAGIAREDVLIWSAHNTGKPHICGPDVCGYPQADATQYTFTEDGASLDASLCYAYFFAGPGGEIGYQAPAVAPPAPAPEPVKPVVVPPPPKPAAPQHLAAEASYRGVTLLWAPVAGVKEYDVQLIGPDSKEAGRIKSFVAKVALPVTADTEYKFRVASLPGGEWSAEFAFKSAVDPATVPVAPPAPPAPAPLDYTMQILVDGNEYKLPAGTIIFTPKEA